MNQSNHFISIAIVGGGPIGLSLAILLAKKSNGRYQIDLYEKRKWPVDKVCGQGLMPSGVQILEKLGLDFSQFEHSSLKGVTYKEQELELKGNLKRDFKAVERVVLSKKLYELATSCEEISLFDNHKVSGIQNRADEVILDFNEHEKKVYDYCFACDGLQSKLRSLLGNEISKMDHPRQGARIHINQVPWSDHVEVFWGNSMEAYVTPVSQNRIEIAFLWYQHELNNSAMSKPLNPQRLLSLFPDLLARVDLSRADSKDFRVSPPFIRRSKRIKKGNVFFVGDAYQFIDGITGEGVSMGLKSAGLLAESFENFDWTAKFRIRLLYLNYQLWVWLSLFLSSHPKFRNSLFRTLKWIDPNGAIMELLIRFNDLNFQKREAMT